MSDWSTVLPIVLLVLTFIFIVTLRIVFWYLSPNNVLRRPQAVLENPRPQAQNPPPPLPPNNLENFMTLVVQKIGIGDEIKRIFTKAAKEIYEDDKGDLTDEKVAELLHKAYSDFSNYLPIGHSFLSMPLITYLPNTHPVLKLYRTFQITRDGSKYSSDHSNYLFPKMREAEIRGWHTDAVELHNAGIIKLHSPDCTDVVLGPSPFRELSTARVPIILPREKWFQHCSIWGTSGKGKTTLLQALIADRLVDVALNKCSIVVMDSQGAAPGSLIHDLSHNQIFAPGGRLYGKLLYIEPDPEHPIAMNPFQMGRTRQSRYSTKDSEQLQNNTIELLSYVFSTQTEGAAFTHYQATLYRFCIEFLLQVPGANLTTFQQLLIEGPKKFVQFIPRLSEAGQIFWTRQFQDRQFHERAKEVAARLSNVLQNNAIAGMFNARECRLDLFTELASSKVIVISPDKNYLGDERCMLYGRMMIALLLRAAQERLAVPKSERLPVYCFIDEAHDYIRNDPKIVTILDQARKLNISMTCANQRTAQITDAKVLDALLSSAITFASTDNESDAHKLAPIMHTTPEELRRQPEYHFALSVSGLMDAKTVRVERTMAEDVSDHMSSEAFNRLLEDIRGKYAERSGTYEDPQGPMDEDIVDADFEEVTPSPQISFDPDDPPTSRQKK